MDKTEALLGHFPNLAAYLEIEAGDCESGNATHSTAMVEDSADFAADLRHKRGNVLAVISCFRRLRAREEGQPGASLAYANTLGPESGRRTCAGAASSRMVRRRAYHDTLVPEDGRYRGRSVGRDAAGAAGLDTDI
jgi:hypothetical protein